ncbi:MAG: hypothetical protein O7G87_13045 [bacterium]|nr:hypothetical protein [bacterium]
MDLQKSRHSKKELEDVSEIGPYFVATRFQKKQVFARKGADSKPAPFLFSVSNGLFFDFFPFFGVVDNPRFEPFFLFAQGSFFSLDNSIFGLQGFQLAPDVAKFRFGFDNIVPEPNLHFSGHNFGYDRAHQGEDHKNTGEDFHR